MLKGFGTLRKVLLTGADGFIGSHLAEELVRRNFEVRAFVHYNSMSSHGWLDWSPAEIRKQLDVFAGDIRDPNGVRTAMKGCDAVLHLAALIAIPYSYRLAATPTSTPTSTARSTCCRRRAISASRRSCTPRPARSTAPRSSCRSPRSIRCRASRPTRRARSAPTRSRCRFTHRSARR